MCLPLFGLRFGSAYDRRLHGWTTIRDLLLKAKEKTPQRSLLRRNRNASERAPDVLGEQLAKAICTALRSSQRSSPRGQPFVAQAVECIQAMARSLECDESILPDGMERKLDFYIESGWWPGAAEPPRQTRASSRPSKRSTSKVCVGCFVDYSYHCPLSCLLHSSGGIAFKPFRPTASPDKQSGDLETVAEAEPQSAKQTVSAPSSAAASGRTDDANKAGNEDETIGKTPKQPAASPSTSDSPGNDQGRSSHNLERNRSNAEKAMSLPPSVGASDDLRHSGDAESGVKSPTNDSTDDEFAKHPEAQVAEAPPAAPPSASGSTEMTTDGILFTPK